MPFFCIYIMEYAELFTYDYKKLKIEPYICSEPVLALSICHGVCGGDEVRSDLPLEAGAEGQERKGWDNTHTYPCFTQLTPHKAHWEVLGKGERCCIPLSSISALPSCPTSKCLRSAPWKGTQHRLLLRYSNVLFTATTFSVQKILKCIYKL